MALNTAHINTTHINTAHINTAHINAAHISVALKKVVTPVAVVCFHNPDEENGPFSNWYLSEFIVADVTSIM